METLAAKLTGILGGNIGDTIAKVVGVFKLSPEQAAQHAEDLTKIAADATAKQTDAAITEMNAAKDVILAEANSQSWLPRNVRPLLLLIWGFTITANAFIPLIARYWVPGLVPFQLDPWIYKLTAIGFTGYVTARTWEKVTDKE